MMEDIQDKIDNYLLGRMSNAETRAMEQEIAADAETREIYVSTQMIKHELADRNAKMVQLQQWKKRQEETPLPNHIKRKLWYGIGGFSAAAVIVFGFFLFRQPQIMPSTQKQTFTQSQSPADIQIYAKSYEEQVVSKIPVEEQEKITAEHERLLSQVRANQRQISFKGAQNMQQFYATASVSTSNNDYAQKYMHEAEYYQKKAEGYRREAEYYQKKAKNYENEQQYYIKKAQGYQNEAAYYSKKGDIDRSRTYSRYASDAMDNAKTQARYAKDALDNYKMYMNWAKEADEKTSMYLRWAQQALD